MRVDNKDFFKQNLFIERVQNAIARRNMDYDRLYKLLKKRLSMLLQKVI